MSTTNDKEEDNKEAVFLTMNDLHSMIMKSIQDAQKQMQDIQLQLKWRTNV